MNTKRRLRWALIFIILASGCGQWASAGRIKMCNIACEGHDGTAYVRADGGDCALGDQWPTCQCNNGMSVIP